MLVGYTTGAFDMFHIGHLNILKCASEQCDRLIVGVATDETILEMKGQTPVIPFEERIEIVDSIRYVDQAVAKTNTNNLLAWEKYKFNIFLKGDDWKGTAKGMEIENYFSKVGVKVVYSPYTKGMSSTALRKIIHDIGQAT